jgi:hypothetical protein
MFKSSEESKPQLYKTILAIETTRIPIKSQQL